MASISNWITVNGVHIPIMKGQSKNDAVKKFIANRNNKVGKYHKGASFYQEGNVVGITQYRIQKAKRKYAKSNEGYFTAKDKLRKSIEAAENTKKYTKKQSQAYTSKQLISYNETKLKGLYKNSKTSKKDKDAIKAELNSRRI